MRHTKLCLASLVATFLLATAVDTAAAGRLSVDETRFRVVWRLLSFTTEGFEPISCPVTLEGSFHSATLRKVIGALIGYVSRGTTVPNACTGGRATILQETLPWHITYEGFSGTLPDIREIHVLLTGAGFRIATPGGLSCLSKTTIENPAEGWITLIREAGGILKTRQLVPNSARRIPCRGILTLNGTFSQPAGEGQSIVTRLGSSTAILVKLI